MKGTPDNPDEKIYQLKDNKTGELTDFLSLGSNQLSQLDNGQRRIKSSSI